MKLGDPIPGSKGVRAHPLGRNPDAQEVTLLVHLCVWRQGGVPQLRLHGAQPGVHPYKPTPPPRGGGTRTCHQHMWRSPDGARAPIRLLPWAVYGVWPGNGACWAAGEPVRRRGLGPPAGTPETARTDGRWDPRGCPWYRRREGLGRSPLRAALGRGHGGLVWRKMLLDRIIRQIQGQGLLTKLPEKDWRELFMA